MRSALLACWNMTIIQLWNRHKVTKTTVAECKCYFTRSQTGSLQDGKDDLTKSNGPCRHICILIVSLTLHCQTSNKLEHPVFLELCQIFLPPNSLKAALLMLKSLQLVTHINYKYNPRWHVNKHKRNCSLGASSENICILQTRHLAKVTHEFAAEPLPGRWDVISSKRIHDALNRAAASGKYLAEITNLRGKFHQGFFEMLSISRSVFTAREEVF